MFRCTAICNARFALCTHFIQPFSAVYFCFEHPNLNVRFVKLENEHLTFTVVKERFHSYRNVARQKDLCGQNLLTHHKLYVMTKFSWQKMHVLKRVSTQLSCSLSKQPLYQWMLSSDAPLNCGKILCICAWIQRRQKAKQCTVSIVVYEERDPKILVYREDTWGGVERNHDLSDLNIALGAHTKKERMDLWLCANHHICQQHH